MLRRHLHRSSTLQTNTQEQSTSALLIKGQPQKTVLLSTVLLVVIAADGHRRSLRALLDSGSQASFIVEQTANLLNLQRRQSSVSISTFGSNAPTRVCGKAQVTITPCKSQTPSFSVETMIVPQITGLTPQIPVQFGNWDHIRNLPLADPTYHRPGAIDMLLGADILPSMFLNGQRTGQTGEPMAMETVFGWVLMEPTAINQVSIHSFNVTILEKLDVTLKQFWNTKNCRPSNI